MAYGGDLRTDGFTDFLLELIHRYQGHPMHTGPISVTSYLAWPVHIRMTTKELVAFRNEHKRAARVVFLARDGTSMERNQILNRQCHEPDDAEWRDGLTSMRTRMRNETQARILLGGAVKDYKGCMPGIAEEMLLSLQAGKPVFLIGGYGGCSRDIAEAMGLVKPWVGSRTDWSGRLCFEKYSAADLHNGLSYEENALLARTPHISQAVILVSRGLRKITNNLSVKSKENINA